MIKILKNNYYSDIIVKCTDCDSILLINDNDLLINNEIEECPCCKSKWIKVKILKENEK